MVKHVVRPKICELLRLRESQKSQCFQGIWAFFKILDLKSVVCTRNWRDTTFATPRNIELFTKISFGTRNRRSPPSTVAQSLSVEDKPLLQLVALGGFASLKTILNCFQFATFATPRKRQFKRVLNTTQCIIT